MSQMAPRVALITGCAQGIGRGIILRLAEDGYSLALNDIPSKKEQLQDIANVVQRKGVKTTIVCADVSNEKEVEDMVAKTVAELGSLDIVRNFLLFGQSEKNSCKFISL